MCSYKEVPGYIRSRSPETKYLCKVICPQKITHAHNVFEVAELCRTQADILNPRSIGHFSCSLADHQKYKQNPLCQVLASICGQKKSQSLSNRSQSNYTRF